MKSLAAFVFLLLIQCTSSVYAEESVVSGRPAENIPLEVGIVCITDYACHSSWARWTFTVSKTLAGPTISGTVSAVRHQGGQFRIDGNESEKRLRAIEDFIFVLRPIVDPNVRAKFRADYYIPDMSKPILIYCLNEKPQGVEVFTDGIAGLKYPGVPTYCFQLPTWEVHGI